MDSPTEQIIARAASIGSSALANIMGDPMERDSRLGQIAAVQTRQDVAAIYVVQVGNHAQLVNISRGVWALVFVAIFIFGRQFL